MQKYLKKPVLLCGISILIVVLPLIPTMLAVFIGKLFGCVVNEGGGIPCVVLGLDVGNMLSFMGAMFLISLFILPLSILGLLIGIPWLIFNLITKGNV